MRYLVTGANGFLGSRMVAFLKERGHWVRAVDIDNEKFPQRRVWRDQADEVLRRDLRNPDEARDAVEGMDITYHYSADMGGVGYFSQANYTPYLNNTRMDLNMVEASVDAGVKRMFFSSSACAYPIYLQEDEGETLGLAEDQLLPAEADQMYGWEKLMMILLAPHAPLDLRIGIFHTIFGPGQETTGQRAKFPPTIVQKVIDSKRTGSPIEIWGNGRQTRTFLYIEDALEKIYEVMTAEDYWGPVNIAADEIVTVRQCADWLCDYAGIEPTYVFNSDKPSGVLARGADNSKFYQHYAYHNRFTTREGFERFYDYLTTHPDET